MSFINYRGGQLLVLKLAPYKIRSTAYIDAYEGHLYFLLSLLLSSSQRSFFFISNLGICQYEKQSFNQSANHLTQVVNLNNKNYRFNFKRKRKKLLTPTPIFKLHACQNGSMFVAIFILPYYNNLLEKKGYIKMQEQI